MRPRSGAISDICPYWTLAQKGRCGAGCRRRRSGRAPCRARSIELSAMPVGYSGPAAAPGPSCRRFAKSPAETTFDHGGEVLVEPLGQHPGAAFRAPGLQGRFRPDGQSGGFAGFGKAWRARQAIRASRRAMSLATSVVAGFHLFDHARLLRQVRAHLLRALRWQHRRVYPAFALFAGGLAIFPRNHLLDRFRNFFDRWFAVLPHDVNAPHCACCAGMSQSGRACQRCA